MEGDTQAFDEAIVRALRDPDDASKAIGPRWLESMARDITAAGGFAVLCAITLGVFGFLVIQRKYRAALLLLLAVVGALLVSTLLKEIFDRPRPTVVPHLTYVSTSSFPSGHSTLSAAVYLTLGSLLARMSERRRLKVYFLSFALLITVLVGVSRVFMGVHYPTDVLAGWSVGLAWATLCWLVARKLQHKGKVETDAAHPEPPKAGHADHEDADGAARSV
jgi:undecaprenyl-diphosphatase